MERLHIKLRRLEGRGGFTLVEVTMAALIIAFVVAGVWGVYWSVVNTYYLEQKDTNIQAEGDRLIDMIANGGYAGGRRVYGLSSMVQVQSGSTKYPNVGTGASFNFSGWDNSADSEDCSETGKEYIPRGDYRIEFVLDSVSGNTRYAEFAVQLYACDPLDPKYYSKAILWFRLRTDGKPGTDNEFNYQVKLTENLLQRTETGGDCGDYSLTWFKAQLLPKDPATDLYTGIKVSFYLNDSLQPVTYNCDLDRKLSSPTGNPDQDRTLMGAIPYPKYFSTTIYFPKGG